MKRTVQSIFTPHITRRYVTAKKTTAALFCLSKLSYTQSGAHFQLTRKVGSLHRVRYGQSRFQLGTVAYLFGLDHQIWRFGDCLLSTHVPRSPTTMFSTPCCIRPCAQHVGNDHACMVMRSKSTLATKNDILASAKASRQSRECGRQAPQHPGKKSHARFHS